MTFNEAIKELRVFSMDGTQPMDDYDVIHLINNLRQEYAPDVVMNQSEYEMFSYYLDSYTFAAFLESIHRMDTAVMFGVDTKVYFEDLTEEDLMSAWLNPSSIKVVEQHG